VTVLEIVAEVLECAPESISEEFAFRADPRWDSLAALTLITSIEDEFGIVVSGTELEGIGTVAELGALLDSRR
jgi:acyl carrier protein